MTPEVATAQDLSKAVFNAQHRLAIAAVFDELNAVFSYEEVAERAAVSRSVAHKELSVLVRIGALARIEVGRSVNYQRSPSAFWAFASELIHESRLSESASR